MQAAMCLASIVCGTRMVYVVNRSSWTIVMQQVNTSFLLCAQGTQFIYNLRPHHWVPCGFTSLCNSLFCRLLSRWWSLHQLSDILVGRLYFDRFTLTLGPCNIYTLSDSKYFHLDRQSCGMSPGTETDRFVLMGIPRRAKLISMNIIFFKLEVEK